jgi:hypothetical protein
LTTQPHARPVQQRAGRNRTARSARFRLSRGIRIVTSSTPARTVLAEFLPATFARPAHPERATTACSCRSPEPCWEHEPHAGRTPATAPLPAVRPVPGSGGPRPAIPAPSVCQCIAPEPCRVHPDDRPYLKRPPAWNAPHPDGGIGRFDRRPEPGGALLEVEARQRLPKFTDRDLVLLRQLVEREALLRGLL